MNAPVRSREWASVVLWEINLTEVGKRLFFLFNGQNEKVGYMLAAGGVGFFFL